MYLITKKTSFRSILNVGDGVLYGIVSNLRTEELIFVIGCSCQYWRKHLAFPIVKERMMKQFNSEFMKIKSFNDLFITREGRAMTRQVLRECVRFNANELLKYQIINEIDNKVIADNSPTITEMFNHLKYYFSFYQFPWNQAKKEEVKKKSGILGFLFGVKKEENTETGPIIVNINDPKEKKKEERKDYDYLA